MGKAHAPPTPPTPCPLTHGQWSVSSAPFLASCHGVVEGRGGGPVVCDSAGKRIIRKIFSKGETGLLSLYPILIKKNVKERLNAI